MWGLGVLIPLLAAGALRVIQEPGELQVTAGDTATLGCRVEVAESRVQLRMEWVRDGGLGVLCATRLVFATHPDSVTLPDFVTPTSLSPCPHRVPEVQLAWHPPRATLSLPQVQGNDSGRYICRVILEIPRHRSATGNGTELRVTPGAPGGQQAALLWGLVGTLGGTVLVLGVALLGYRCCHRSPDTAIYLNVVSSSARDPKKPPPPELQHNLYQQERQRPRPPPLPPRP